jgi:hypothetical protein
LAQNVVDYKATHKEQFTTKRLHVNLFFFRVFDVFSGKAGHIMTVINQKTPAKSKIRLFFKWANASVLFQSIAVTVKV